MSNKYISYYANGCKKDGEEGDVCVCPDSIAEFYTVYGVSKDGKSHALGDFPTKEDANNELVRISNK